MSDRIHKRELLLAGLGAALLPPWSRAQSLSEPKWFALLYRANADYVEVQIDTRRMLKNQIIRTVRVGIDFFDAKARRLGGRSFLFTDGNPPALVAGELFRKFFSQPYGAAVSARGTQLYHDGLAGGGAKFDAGGLRPAAAAIIDPADSSMPGAPLAKP